MYSDQGCGYSNNGYMDVSSIKEKIPVKAFYEQEAPGLDFYGRSVWARAGLCPFHADKSTGSFYIHKHAGAFNCYSCNAKGGDIISFTQKKYNLTFKEACQKLIKEWNL